jgi:hypothetical protein
MNYPFEDRAIAAKPRNVSLSNLELFIGKGGSGRRTIPGDILSLPVGAIRWTPRLKLIVAFAIRAGVITGEIARERFMLSAEELALWDQALDQTGIDMLRATQRRR